MIIVNFQELSREVGKLSFSYEAEVKRWSNSDFKFSYTVSPLTNNCSISTEIYFVTHDHQCKDINFGPDMEGQSSNPV